MDLELKHELAVVVGGANGIGLAIAEAFAREGARVALLDLDPATDEKARRLAERTGATSFSRTLDVTDSGQVRDAYRSLVDEAGHCKHVVYAAGLGSRKYGFPFWDLEPADWPRVLAVNLLGAVHAAHAFGASLRQTAPSSLLFVSSVAGQIGSQTDPPYSAAKAALLNFAECAAKDFAPFDVRVNSICPGMIRSELNRSVWQAWRNKQPDSCDTTYEQWAADKIQRTIPLRRWQTPEDVAAMAVFLASPRCRNVTGQTMNVDGGQVMHW